MAYNYKEFNQLSSSGLMSVAQVICLSQGTMELHKLIRLREIIRRIV